MKSVVRPGLMRSDKIRLIAVDIGVKTIAVPVADIRGETHGRTLLVTAGVDGDEYAGVEAAYEIVAKLSEVNFAGRAIVIPILNIPGYEAECSQNPLDGKFPKYVFPGKPDGSPTERLMHWLATTYVSGAHLWLDLHGGAITERVSPFVWVYKTGVKEADAVVDEIINGLTGPVLYERVGLFSKAKRLAQKGCAYCITESGSLGGRTKADVGRHVTWALHVARCLGLLGENEAIRAVHMPPVFTRVFYETPPFPGFWRPNAWNGYIRKGQEIGILMSLDRTKTRSIRAHSSGICLWRKEAPRVVREDILLAVGSR